MKLTEKFDTALKGPEIVVVPGAYDVMSAKIARDLGFAAVYTSSHSLSSMSYGINDLGFVGRDQMRDLVSRIVDSVDIPVIADGENGWGNAIHVGHTVRLFERAGTAAITLEDSEFGKHLIEKPSLTPKNKFADKIRAAVDARQDPMFKIVARTDSLPVEGFEPAYERIAAYAEAGADLVWMIGCPLSEMRRISEATGALILDTNPLAAPETPVKVLEEAGQKVALFWNVPYGIVYRTVRESLKTLKEEGGAASLVHQLADMHELDAYFGVEEARDKAVKYRVFAG